ncbi:MAG: hypothetical protein AVW06_03075 [Hadesarchaea archaeon DG-33-1]|nr:MAG: hypothetical protein AVW06_03075 [Hadesarchaea archaeon DG-33-1]
MKEKGVSLIAVIAIVIIIAVVAVVAVLLLRGGGTGLPVYSGAQKLGEQSQSGLTGEVFWFTGSGEGAYNWYKPQMTGQGWTLSQDLGYNADYGGGLYYTKGNEIAVILIYESASDISAVEAEFGDVPSGAKVLMLARGTPNI